MDTRKAIDLINSVSYKPGWEISAHHMIPGIDLGLVVAEARIETVNTNRDMALVGYPEKIVIQPDHTFDVGRYGTESELLGAVFAWLLEVELHEAREFFRVGTDMHAPFHPHREDGNAAWQAATSAPVA